MALELPKKCYSRKLGSGDVINRRKKITTLQKPTTTDIDMPTTIISLRLSDGAVVVLSGVEGAEAWGACIRAMEPPVPGEIVQVLTYLQRRVIAYRVESGPWRALDAFNIPGDA